MRIKRIPETDNKGGESRKKQQILGAPTLHRSYTSPLSSSNVPAAYFFEFENKTQLKSPFLAYTFDVRHSSPTSSDSRANLWGSFFMEGLCRKTESNHQECSPASTNSSFHPLDCDSNCRFLQFLQLCLPFCRAALSDLILHRD